MYFFIIMTNLLYVCLLWQTIIPFTNPSLEGVPKYENTETVAHGWFVCSYTPDLFGDSPLVLPQHGISYVGVVCCPVALCQDNINSMSEAFGQQLVTPLVPNTPHQFTMFTNDLAHASNYSESGIEIWAGHDSCQQEQLLWVGRTHGDETSSIPPYEWFKETVEFVPNAAYTYMRFQAHEVAVDSFTGLFIDNLSPIYVNNLYLSTLYAEQTALCPNTCTLLWVEPFSSINTKEVAITWSSIPEGYNNEQNSKWVSVCPTEPTYYIAHIYYKDNPEIDTYDTILITLLDTALYDCNTLIDTTTNPIDTLGYQPVKGATRYKPPGGWALFPNMVAPGGSVNIHAPQAGQLALYNTLGQLVWSVRAIPSGYDAYNLPNNLAQGIYYYHFTPNNPREEEKPVIVGKILVLGSG
ncbi:MAG: hypothetical protein IPN25_00190 [Sphingobacteriales bacterium]|jgi:hypothetical protein|nr:hypothetical protein [Sphingobacteriales bacterium]